MKVGRDGSGDFGHLSMFCKRVASRAPGWRRVKEGEGAEKWGECRREGDGMRAREEGCLCVLGRTLVRVVKGFEEGSVGRRMKGGITGSSGDGQ